jgi:hypothetical protein
MKAGQLKVQSRKLTVKVRRFLLTFNFFILLLLASGCDSDVPTPIPTRTLSGPTTEPTPVFYPDLPTPDAVNPGISDPTAAALPRDAELPPLVLESGAGIESIQLTAGDGALLTGDLYPALSGERAPGILLIAPDGAAWGDFALRLRERGYTVLSMHMRANAPLGDAIAMLQGLATAGSVDPGRIGVVGAEIGADLALVMCAGDLLCDALAMITPIDARGVGYLSSYLPRPLWMSAAQDDPAFTIAERFQATAPNGFTFISAAGAERGGRLIAADSALADALIGFLAGAVAP